MDQIYVAVSAPLEDVVALMLKEWPDLKAAKVTPVSTEDAFWALFGRNASTRIVGWSTERFSIYTDPGMGFFVEDQDGEKRLAKLSKRFGTVLVFNYGDSANVWSFAAYRDGKKTRAIFGGEAAEALPVGKPFPEEGALLAGGLDEGTLMELYAAFGLGDPYEYPGAAVAIS